MIGDKKVSRRILLRALSLGTVVGALGVALLPAYFGTASSPAFAQTTMDDEGECPEGPGPGGEPCGEEGSPEGPEGS